MCNKSVIPSDSEPLISNVHVATRVYMTHYYCLCVLIPFAGEGKEVSGKYLTFMKVNWLCVY